MAFIFGGGIGLGGGGGLFGTAPAQNRIVGIGADILAANFNAKLTNSTLASLSNANRAAFDLSGVSDDVTPPWETDILNEEENGPRSLDNRVREIRDGTAKFIDLKDDALNSVKDDPDRQAAFALYRALDKLRTLAEYAAADTTIESSLERLDKRFQQGFGEIRDFLAEGTTDKLELFLGDKEFKTESAVRSGKNQSEITFGAVNTKTPDDILEGLTGTEVFSIDLTKEGVTDTIEVDLSGLTGDLTLNNIKDYINTQIESLPLLDDLGDPKLDGDGNPISKYLTRFNVSRLADDSYTLKAESLSTEQISFSAAASEEALYVTGNVSQLDDSFAVTSRLIDFTNIATGLTIDNITSFAATDIDASELKALTADQEEDALDPELAKLRDKFKSDAQAEADKQQELETGLPVTEETDTTAEDEGSITNIDSDNRVVADTVSQGVVVDSQGNSYVVGHSKGSFDMQYNAASENDVFLSKFDSEGNLLYTRLLGVSDNANAYGVTVDSEDNVIITGQTNSAVVVQTNENTDKGIINGDVIEGSLDTFVTKYSSNGTEVFRYQLDSTPETSGLSVTVDSNNDIFVAGKTSSAFKGSTAFGGGQSDGVVLKLSGTDGAELSKTLVGGAGSEKISNIAVGNDGNILVTVEDAGGASLKKLDASDLTNELASVDIGTIGSTGAITGIAVEGNQIVLSGYSQYDTIDSGGTATVNGSHSGRFDGFVASFTDSGAAVSADYVTFIGTDKQDLVNGVTLNNGKIYVAGSTSGDLNGQTRVGNKDAFVTRLDAATGAIEDTKTLGEGLASVDVTGIGFTEKGNSVLSVLGLPQGAAKFDQTIDLTTQTSLRAGDNFYIAVDGGKKLKIEIEEGDTFRDLARQIRVAALGKFKVEIASTSEGEKLKIQTLEKTGSPSLDILAGDEGRDALAKLGIDAGRILAQNEVLNINDDEDIEPDGPEDLGGSFGLKLDGALHIRDKKTAKYVLGLLDTAIGTIQRAERSLTFNPLRALIRNGSLNNEPPPPRIAAQISNYQDALSRLQAGSLSGPTSLFT